MDYLTQESFKIFKPAFLALYQIFPYGRFAHFLASSEVLNAMPQDAEVICVVDFDIGEGLQWPSLIESLGRKKRRCIVRLISIKWEEDRYSFSRCLWKFEETKRHLSEYARCFNVKLEMEEMNIERLVKEVKLLKMNEWLVFNCMVNLPHMGRSRSRKHVVKFLKIAKNSINNGGFSKGIITFADGLMEKGNCCGFGAFMEDQMVNYHALLESMDTQFPIQLIEARIAMECLFTAPYLSSFACLERWEENSLQGRDFSAIGLKARRLNNDGVAEAKELVRGRESQYHVRSGEENEHELVLGYMETPLVRVCSWD